MMSTLGDKLMLEKMPQCSCGKDKAIFYCKFPACKLHHQKYSCTDCAETHEHGPLSIVKETTA